MVFIRHVKGYVAVFSTVELSGVDGGGGVGLGSFSATQNGPHGQKDRGVLGKGKKRNPELPYQRASSELRVHTLSRASCDSNGSIRDFRHVPSQGEGSRGQLRSELADSPFLLTCKESHASDRRERGTKIIKDLRDRAHG